MIMVELRKPTGVEFDDITTGEVVKLDSEPTGYTLTHDGQSVTFYCGPKSAPAFDALIKEDGDAFRKVFALAKVTTDREGKRDEETNATSAEIREWATANSIAVNTRARIPNDVRTKFREAVKSGAYTVKDTEDTDNSN